VLDPVALAARLIDIPSVTGDELAMAEASAALLREIGFDVRLMPAAPDRPNVLATLDPPRVLLCTHLDTVPPHFSHRRDGEWLYGRGACDTKGILAAMLVAAAQLVAEGVRDCGLLLVVGEETDSIGAKRANADIDLPGVAYTLVGEPTSLEYAVAQKRRSQVDAARHRKGSALRLSRTRRVRDSGVVGSPGARPRNELGEDPVLGAGTANIGTVHGGLRANIVPERAEAKSSCASSTASPRCVSGSPACWPMCRCR
jgi:acetylornithine deacetylase